MPRVFTTHPGDVRRIGNFGEASNEAAAVVPPAVAKELAHDKGLRIEPDKPTEEDEAPHKRRKG